MPITMSMSDHDELLRRAAASPDEICGLLLGDPAHVAQIVACRNVAATPAIRFDIDPVALIAAHRAARGGAPAVIGHYHSHPTGDARPSPRDAADARPDGAIWLLIAGGRVTAWRAVDDGEWLGRFDPLALVLNGCAPPRDPSQDPDVSVAR